MKRFNHKTGQSIDIDDAKIYCEEIGNANKPILLFLHGGFQTIEDLNAIASHLSQHFRIIGIDSRGHGRSTLGSEALTYQRMQHDVEAVLKYLHLDKVSILGFSDGGIVALRIAAGNAVKVEKLIAIGSEWSATNLSGREQIFKGITPKSAKGMFSGYYKSYQDMNPEPDFDRFTKSVVDMWCDKGKSGYPNESVKVIKTQLLLIRGDQDFLTSLESTVELHRIIENSYFLNVPFAEHVVYEEQKDICQRVIHQFLFEQHIDK